MEYGYWDRDTCRSFHIYRGINNLDHEDGNILQSAVLRWIAAVVRLVAGGSTCSRRSLILQKHRPAQMILWAVLSQPI